MLLLTATAPPVAAQAPGVEAGSEIAELRAAVTDRFRVIPTLSGLLLEPLEEIPGVESIELTGGQLAIGGGVVDAAEVRARLGDPDAGLVLRLAALSDEQLRRVAEASALPMAAQEGSEEVEQAEDEAVDEGDEPEAAVSRSRPTDAQVVFGSALTVDRDEAAQEAVVFGAPLTVEGRVLGDAAAIGGPVTVGEAGEVTGSVVAVGGRITLEPGARVMGDAVSIGGEVDRGEGAEVMGQIIEVPFGPQLSFGWWPGMKAWSKGRHHDEWFEFSPWKVATRSMFKVLGVVLLALLACLVMLLAERPLERVTRRVAAEPWKSGLVGLIFQILFLPLLLLVVLILVVSIIGIPLLLLVPFAILAFVLVAFLGFCGVAYGIGRFLESRFGWKLGNPYLALVVGVVVIQIWSLIGGLLDFGWGPLWFFAVMFLFVGALVKYAAWTVGLGGALLTRFGTADGWGGAAALPPAPSGPPAPPADELDVIEEPGMGAPEDEGSWSRAELDQPWDPGAGEEPDERS